MKKGTKIHSVLHLKCPQCHEGDLFPGKNPYDLRELDNMASTCKVCGEQFSRETDFYIGSLMVSHAITTVVALIIHSIVYYFFGWAPVPNIIALLFVFLVLIPLILRRSRAIWVHWFVK